MSDSSSSSSIGFIGLLIAYALHLWAVAEGHALLAIITWWYCVVSLILVVILLLILFGIGVFVGLAWLTKKVRK